MRNREEMDQIRAHGCYMQDTCLAELYTYLQLFTKTYLCGRDEAESLLETIRYVYSLEYPSANPDEALRKLHNPRNAGRKPCYSGTMRDEILKLHKEGRSIRDISAQMGLSHSTVQRILQ